MIASLTITGIGPLAAETRIDLDNPRGCYELRGPSRHGKSTVLDAVCFVLYGTDRHGEAFPVENIAAGCDAAAVELVTGSGTVLRRTMDRKRRVTRSVQKRGADPVEARTEEAWREHIGTALSRVITAEKRAHAAARLAMVPMSWVPLVQGNARAFRDVLTVLLPPADLGAEVDRLLAEAGHARKPGDPATVKAAEDARRDANRAADQADGRASADAARVLELEAPIAAGPGAEEVKRAREVLAAFGAWDLYDTALRTHEANVAAAAGVDARAMDWDARKAALGERPSFDIATLRLAHGRKREAASVKARAELTARGAADRLAKADAAAALAEKVLAELAGAGDTCPTCGRDGWAEAAVKRAAAEAENARARDALADAQREDAVAREALAAAERELAAAEEAERAAQAESATVDAWDQALAALGKRPAAGATPVPPTRPPTVRPGDDDVLAAQSTVDEATRAEGARSQRARDLEDARRLATASRRAADAANQEAARLDAYVDALRRAPTEIAKRQKEALGDLGPVDVSFPEDGPAVELTIGGQPWYRASTGERVHADLCLRLAFRRLLVMPWLPVFLDEMQSWSGPWPELVGPVIGLRTVKTAGIRVEPFGADLTDEDVRGAGERAA